MKKSMEIERSDSCFNKARLDERMFVILERDIAAPGTIRDWCKRRIRAKKNLPGDAQIKEALLLALEIEEQQSV